MEREEILKYIDEIVTRDQNGNLYIKEIDIGKLNHRDYVKFFKELDELNIPTDSNEKISNVDLDKLTEFLFNDFIPENVEIVEDNENKVIPLRKIVDLKLSKEEYLYTIDYLHSMGIEVPGAEEYLKNYYIGNYYCSDYYKTLPIAATKDANFEYFEQLNNCTDEKEREQIRNKIICKNIKLANYATICCLNRFDVNVEDYFTYAYEKLMECVDKYDFNLGFAFSTYAFKAIYRYVFRSYCSELDYPCYIAEKFVMAQLVVQKAFGKKYIRGDKEMLNDIILILSKLGINCDILNKIYYRELLYNEKSKKMSSDAISTEDVENCSLNKNFSEFFSKFIDESLKEREARIIHMLYYDLLTLKEVAEDYNLTDERIRQIEAKSLRKLEYNMRQENIRYTDFCY